MKETLKRRLILYVNLTSAILLGVFAQDIAYFLYYNFSLPLMASLTLTTLISIFLFILSPVLLKKFAWEYKIRRQGLRFFLIVNAIAGLAISGFSILVWLFWLA